MATNIQVEKTGNENNIILIKKFNKKVQRSGILAKARAGKYNRRPKSNHTKKVKALKVLKRRKEVDKLIKLGKLPDRRARIE